ncbi:zinc-ribbon domain containing protein [soil metagenome]
MSDSEFAVNGLSAAQAFEMTGEFDDAYITCIDCAQGFVWTAGEQLFYRDKQLLNPPKRCKDCKKAKNRRLEAIENSRATGQKHRIEVKANCEKCGKSTTVPFYPCQNRPVYCRTCFVDQKPEAAKTNA